MRLGADSGTVVVLGRLKGQVGLLRGTGEGGGGQKAGGMFEWS